MHQIAKVRGLNLSKNVSLQKKHFRQVAIVRAEKYEIWIVSFSL